MHFISFHQRATLYCFLKPKGKHVNEWVHWRVRWHFFRNPQLEELLNFLNESDLSLTVLICHY